MDNWDKIGNIAGAAIFSLLGVCALVGAVFFGATHQFGTAGICSPFATAFILEILREERKKKPQS